MTDQQLEAERKKLRDLYRKRADVNADVEVQFAKVYHEVQRRWKKKARETK